MKKDFLDITDFSKEELLGFLDLATELKKEYFAGGNEPVLKGKNLAMIFQKPSLRTRVSFEVAMRHLGGDALYLSPNEIGLGERESVADVARVLSGMVEGIMARVFGHELVVGLAEWATVPVINGLSDASHPAQIMADFLTIREKFGNFDGLNLAYIGDGNNVSVSLMQMSAILGTNFIIASPEGYDMEDRYVDECKAIAGKTGARLSFFRDPHEAVKEANVIYTDTWVSMGQEEEAAKRQAVFALPGQPKTGIRSPARRCRFALPARLPWHRNHRRSLRWAPKFALPASPQPLACPKSYPLQ
ncbi:MAG TPA: ornithine carbamoyltransferase, partial [Anaerolineaceae bacterium]|nr:ornithine carbamoyltransferase [Anaerolineaceae bacterium]